MQGPVFGNNVKINRSFLSLRRNTQEGEAVTSEKSMRAGLTACVVATLNCLRPDISGAAPCNRAASRPSVLKGSRSVLLQINASEHAVSEERRGREDSCREGLGTETLSLGTGLNKARAELAKVWFRLLSLVAKSQAYFLLQQEAKLAHAAGIVTCFGCCWDLQNRSSILAL